MSRTNKGKKGPGYEYWASRLHFGGELPGKFTKNLTHRKERRNNKQQALEELNDYGNDKMTDAKKVELWDRMYALWVDHKYDNNPTDFLVELQAIIDEFEEKK